MGYVNSHFLCVQNGKRQKGCINRQGFVSQTIFFTFFDALILWKTERI